MLVYTEASNGWSGGNIAYAASSGPTRYNGYFIYGGNVYYYVNGIANQTDCAPQRYEYQGELCNMGGNVLVYTESSNGWNISDTAYPQPFGTTKYNGYFIYGGITYEYSNGFGLASSCPNPP